MLDQLEDIYKQNAYAEKQGDGAKQEVDRFGFTVLGTVGDAMIGNGCGDNHKGIVQQVVGLSYNSTVTRRD